MRDAPGPSASPRVDAAELDEHADRAALVLDVLVAVEDAVGGLVAGDPAELDLLAERGDELGDGLADRLSPRTACPRGRRRPASATSLARARRARSTKSAPLATKSVSQLSSTSAATLPSTTTSTAPWSARGRRASAAPARPFLRSQSLAASRSPSVSASAFLQSIIPAPVALRSAATSFAGCQPLLGQPPRLRPPARRPGRSRSRRRRSRSARSGGGSAAFLRLRSRRRRCLAARPGCGGGLVAGLRPAASAFAVCSSGVSGFGGGASRTWCRHGRRASARGDDPRRPRRRSRGT